MDNFSDEKLVKRYLGGDQAALDFLIERYLKHVYNFVAKFIGNAKEAEDLTQDIFFRAWRNLKKFDAKKSFRIWLFTIARNRSVDYLRKKKMLVFSELDKEDEETPYSETIIDQDESIVDQINKAELAKEVKNYLARLSESNRAVLLLRYNQQMTFQEIAELLGESVDTIKSRHRRALGYLKKAIAEKQEF